MRSLSEAQEKELGSRSMCLMTQPRERFPWEKYTARRQERLARNTSVQRFRKRVRLKRIKMPGKLQQPKRVVRKMLTEEECGALEACKENDSRRWKQLAGKETLTGFRNKEVVGHLWEVQLEQQGGGRSQTAW